MTRHWLLNAVLFMTLTLLSASVQTALWFQVFGNVPTPQLWLIVAIYLMLYRPTLLSYFWVYLIGIVTIPFSAMSLSLLFPTLFFVTLFISYIKSRFFWPSLRYFVFATFAGTILFHVFFVSISHVIEVNPVRISFFHRLAEAVLTTVFASVYFRLCSAIDRILIRETSADVTGAGQ